MNHERIRSIKKRIPALCNEETGNRYRHSAYWLSSDLFNHADTMKTTTIETVKEGTAEWCVDQLRAGKRIMLSRHNADLFFEFIQLYERDLSFHVSFKEDKTIFTPSI
jgi:hypothetical protein